MAEPLRPQMVLASADISGPPPEIGNERVQEDMEIVDTMERLDIELEFNSEEYGALLYVLQVNARFWPYQFGPKEFREAEKFGTDNNWLWTSQERKEISETQDGILLARAQAIPWAQQFTLGWINKTLEEYMQDNKNGKYPTIVESFSPEHTRSAFLMRHNPKLVKPPEETSKQQSGGMGFLIGAVLILLLALGLLTYFLLR